MTIRRLPALVANQIAAGEVIERPASVVKECLENSIDAGASRIDIIIENGGYDLIRIIDNGVGIPQEELHLAIASHATSKLTTLEDLDTIATLGFRGEALASIKSVSRFSISSKTSDSLAASKITVQGNEELCAASPAAHNDGTIIEVRDLFFNTPVRRKFMRTPKSEFGHIETIVKRLALSHFNIAFYLIHNEKTVLQCPASNTDAAIQKRINKIFGSAFLQNSIKIDCKKSNFGLTGWISLPEFSRSQNDLQYFFLNHRTLRDKLVNHALRQAYADQLHEGRYPAYCLNFHCDPNCVDVNVHPTKHEVRFHEARSVHDFLVTTVRNALKKETVEPNLEPLRQYEIQEDSPRYSAPRVNEKISVNENISSHRPIAIVHDNYLLAENTQGLMIIDVDKTEQDIIYQRLTKSYQAGEVTVRPLIIPETVKLDEKFMAVLQAQSENLQKLGFHIEQIEENTVVIRQVPIVLNHAQYPRLLREVLHCLLANNMTQLTDNHIKDLYQIISRHCHVKDKTQMTKSQMNTLIENIEHYSIDAYQQIELEKNT